MAIKTKKISELADIQISSQITDEGISTLDDSSFYLLGCQQDKTGKVSTKNILGVVRKVVGKIVDEKIEEFSKNNPDAQTTVEDDNTSEVDSSIESLKLAQATLGQKIDGVDFKLKNLASSTSSSISNIQESIATLSEKVPPACNCAEKIAALESKVVTLESKVAALEGFVQALQAEGYLTLANIKKAAADACPICTHTHEEPAE